MSQPRVEESDLRRRDEWSIIFYLTLTRAHRRRPLEWGETQRRARGQARSVPPSSKKMPHHNRHSRTSMAADNTPLLSSSVVLAEQSSMVPPDDTDSYSIRNNKVPLDLIPKRECTSHHHHHHLVTLLLLRRCRNANPSFQTFPPVSSRQSR